MGCPRSESPSLGMSGVSSVLFSGAWLVRHYWFKIFKAAQNHGSGWGWAPLFTEGQARSMAGPAREQETKHHSGRRVGKSEGYHADAPGTSTTSGKVFNLPTRPCQRHSRQGNQANKTSCSFTRSGCHLTPSYSSLTSQKKNLPNKHANFLRNMSTSSERRLLLSGDVSHFYFQGHL